MFRLSYIAALIISITLSITIINGCADMRESVFKLPDKFENWTQSKTIKIINSNNIFQYMNGAGELYLSYDFDHLQVFEFTNPDQSSILVEIYLMNSPEDAFGLLSLDWGGEPRLSEALFPTTTTTLTAPSHRALYGAGLLRMAIDSLYVRILSNHDTPEAKKEILSMGQLIAENRKTCPEPELLQRLPLKLNPNYQLKRDRIGFFHSYLVLNMLYYISHQNILNLNLSTKAVFAPYESDKDSANKKRIQLLQIQYPDKEKASIALEQFHKIYLPEFPKILKSNSFKIEDGVMGYRLDENYLTILFELPDLKTANSILSQIGQD